MILATAITEAAIERSPANNLAIGSTIDAAIETTMTETDAMLNKPKHNTNENMVMYIELSTPIGLLVVTSQRDASDRDAVTGVYMESHRHSPVDRRSWLHDVTGHSSALNTARVQLTEYFDGKRTNFDLPLSAHGTDVQNGVWRALSDIPYGETRTYGDIARIIGRPKASRAVGAANGKNPISIIVPCHRVIGSDGSLTGFGGGIERKQWLLAHEARVRTETPGLKAGLFE